MPPAISASAAEDKRSAATENSGIGGRNERRSMISPGKT